MKAIILDLPYPTLDKIKENPNDACIIYPAYSGLHGELTGVLQYVYHHFYFEKQLNDATAQVLMGIALAEMEHYKMLGKAILKLGVSPIITTNLPYRYNPYNTSKILYSKEGQKMLLDDISTELVAIKTYQKMLDKLQDERVSALITRIILDEELHVQVLKKELESLT